MTDLKWQCTRCKYKAVEASSVQKHIDREHNGKGKPFPYVRPREDHSDAEYELGSRYNL